MDYRRAAVSVSLSLHRMRGEGRGEGLRASRSRDTHHPACGHLLPSAEKWRRLAMSPAFACHLCSSKRELERCAASLEQTGTPLEQVTRGWEAFPATLRQNLPTFERRTEGLGTKPIGIWSHDGQVGTKLGRIGTKPGQVRRKADRIGRKPTRIQLPNVPGVCPNVPGLRPNLMGCLPQCARGALQSGRVASETGRGLL